MPTFRHAKLKELARVIFITKLAYRIPYKKKTIITKPHEPKDVKDQFLKKEFFIIVALHNDKIVGAVRYKFLKAKSIYLYKLAVLKTFRNNGIGAKLLKAIEAVAIKKACSKILLNCIQEKKLNDYYKKNGFKVEKIKPYHNHHDVFMFKKIHLIKELSSLKKLLKNNLTIN